MPAAVETTHRHDGRVARSTRTRKAVVEALLALLDEGDVQPTADRIADRAGVSTRTVFGHFADREELLAAASARQHERISALVRPLAEDGALDTRLDAFVAQRTRVLEAVTPVRRAELLMEPSSEQVAAGLSVARQNAQAEVERAFAPELEPLATPERTRVVAALTAIAAWPTWETLRRHQRLGPARARVVMRLMLCAVLTGR